MQKEIKTLKGGVIIENMHDIPYVKNTLLGPETVASMTRVCTAVRNILPSSVACGIQILAGGNKEAMAVAQASNCDFIRVEGFVFGHIADEGYIESCAGQLLRYRSQLLSNRVLIFSDIKKKHCSHTITNDTNIEETADAAEFFCTDGLIVTGSKTGQEVCIQELERVKKRTKIPVIIGSGVTNQNLHKYSTADAFIVGSYFKHDGWWKNGIDEQRIIKLLDKYFS